MSRKFASITDVCGSCCRRLPEFPWKPLEHRTADTRSDQIYCMALSDTYVRYIGHDEAYANGRGVRRSSLEGQVAVAKCRQGEAAAAIPVLEKELTQQKFSLPARG